MSGVASKNLFEVLGNDPELDPDREPEPPTKVVDKPVARTGKRNAGPEAPGAGGAQQRGGGAGGRGGRSDGFGRGDQGGAMNNREGPRDDGLRADRHANRTRESREHRGATDRGGRGQRGGRYGGRYQRTNRDDRQNHSGIGDHEKQAAHGWGTEKDGNAEWTDEQAGEAIAKAEVKDEAGFTPDTSAADPAFSNGPGAEGEPISEEAVASAEPEDKTKSYDQYLAEQAEKRLALGGEAIEVRKANEGSKQKFPTGTEVSRNEENFFVGSGAKARREKSNQAGGKNLLSLDGQYYAPVESGDRGGRGGRGRGRGGRGEFRGGERGGRGRGDGEFRGDRGGRGGGFRGGRGERGGYRGDRGSSSRGDFAVDQSSFPALGS